MDSKVLESLMIPEENLEVANESIGLAIAKILGKGALKFALWLAKWIGIGVIAGLAIVGMSNKNIAKHNQRYNNPTPEELKSRENYNKYWVPKIKELYDMIINDIDKADKKSNIKKYLYIGNSKVMNSEIGPKESSIKSYDKFIFGIDWSSVQYPGADGDDEPDPEKMKDFADKLEFLKPYFNKWKSAAKKFEPYFTLGIYLEEMNTKDSSDIINFEVYLHCKWIDKDRILKPGLPELK